MINELVEGVVNQREYSSELKGQTSFVLWVSPVHLIIANI